MKQVSVLNKTKCDSLNNFLFVFTLLIPHDSLNKKKTSLVFTFCKCFINQHNKNKISYYINININYTINKK